MRASSLLATAAFLLPAALPGQRWPVTTPQRAGVSAAVLDSIDAEVKRGDYGHVDRILVIRGGRLLFDRRYAHDYGTINADSARRATVLRLHDPTGAYNYFNAWWHPYYRKGDLHTLQSVTKTVTSIVIGTAVTRGDFPPLDTPVLSFFDEATVAQVDERKRRMTVRHLLTMTAGLQWDEMKPYSDMTNSAVALEGSHDWVRYAIDRPMSHEPGTVFSYNSGASQLLAHVFRAATGTDIEEYAAAHLFAPLGIRDWHWKRTPTGLVDTEGGLYLASEDLAKLWELWLRDGVWQGTRVVSRDWVRQSVAPAVQVGKTPRRYGLSWWLFPNPADTSRMMWAGGGFGGQHPIAIPELDMVVVVNGWNILAGGKALPAVKVVHRIIAGTKPAKPTKATRTARTN